VDDARRDGAEVGEPFALAGALLGLAPRPIRAAELDRVADRPLEDRPVERALREVRHGTRRHRLEVDLAAPLSGEEDERSVGASRLHVAQ
jgi:hypothetical protein